MKLTLLSEKHVKALHGKWVIQINSNEPDKTITESNWGFIC